MEETKMTNFKNEMENYEINAVEYLVDNFFAQDEEEAQEMVEDGEVRFYFDVHDMEDIAREIVEECGMPSNPEFYIDEDAIKRDLRMDGTFQEMEYERTQEMEENGELEDGEEYEMTDSEEDDFVNELVDIYLSELESPYGNKENVKRFFEMYFDYESFGRDLEIEGTFEEMDMGVWMEIIG